MERHPSLVQPGPESMLLWSVQSRSRVCVGQNCKSNYKEIAEAKHLVELLPPLPLAAPITSLVCRRLCWR